ncbi:hypothetical protein F442_07186 [Phytophthora nicotianae P10297]|uniref:Uncharacterized protein n=1 Tax=Phytophthora nicotianae P10297 TaxID=1317064 RepID=W2ZGZ9_PHYNI|nr:hypothetical protein F442_07186 [Phytophthora nicotianae P10297]
MTGIDPEREGAGWDTCTGSGRRLEWQAWAEAAELREVAGATNYWVLAISAVAGVVVWVVTTPLRNVSWAFLDIVVDNGRAVYFFAYTCGDRYLEAARNANGLALPPLENACALVSLTFLIPIAVLQDYEARFGITGWLCLRWCEAFHHSCCLFVPDAVQLLWVSTCKYARATGEATVAVIERTGDFLMGIYLAASLLLSLLVYLPRLVYESVEGVLGGPLGVVLVVFMVDVYFEFARGKLLLEKTGLESNVKQGWNGLAGRIGRREERERASLERLRGTQQKGTPTETQAEGAKPDGTPKCGVPEVITDKTVRPAVEGTTRRGRRGSVGENCHGLQLDGGRAILADCIQNVCSLQGQRATSNKKGQEKQISAFHV